MLSGIVRSLRAVLVGNLAAPVHPFCRTDCFLHRGPSQSQAGSWLLRMKPSVEETPPPALSAALVIFFRTNPKTVTLTIYEMPSPAAPVLATPTPANPVVLVVDRGRQNGSRHGRSGSESD